MKKRKIKKNILNLLIIFLIVIIIILIIIFFPKKEKDILIADLFNQTKEEVIKYADQKKLKISFNNEINYEVEENRVIRQIPEKNNKIKAGDELIITISLGKPKEEVYKEHQVDELGRVPIMMYHGINNLKNADTGYIGGNVDKDGYQRTTEAFRNDLEFYYGRGYRMIRLEDYIKGIIDVELGKSPVILTFDDGLTNNIKVTGLDEQGNIVIDSNSAIGILEEFKNKYPDYNVTATFFLNGGLFSQPEYNDKIIKWLDENGYDIGNHTYHHKDLTNISAEETSKEVASIYNLFEQKNIKHIKVVALPFGSPYDQTHRNFSSIITSNLGDKKYETISTLRVGWESEISPFSKKFNKLFLKRIRAYDHNGTDFDIEYNFNKLENNKYISDGNKDIITIKKEDLEFVNDNSNLNIVSY